MASPKGYILYRIWYGSVWRMLGGQTAIAGQDTWTYVRKPMHRAIDIHNVTGIEYAELQTEADMNLYEIYFINLWKPPLNVDDKARDNLTIKLPDLEWETFIPSNWDEWKQKIEFDALWKWHKARNDKITGEVFRC